MGKPEKINVEQVKATLRQRLSDKALADGEIAAYVKGVEDSATSVFFKSELTKIGVTSGNIAGASQETMTKLARLIEIKDKSAFSKLKKHFVNVRDANAAFGSEALAELEASGMKGTAGLRNELFNELSSHLSDARSQIAKAGEETAKVKASQEAAKKTTAEAEKKLVDFIGRHNTAPESSELAEALRKIPHGDGVLTMITKGSELDDAAMDALATAVRDNAEPLAAEVGALIKGVKESRSKVVKLEGEIKQAEAAVVKLTGELKNKHPHLEGHDLMAKIEQAAEKTTEAAKTAAKEATKTGGKTKWIVGGTVAAAVALGAVVAVTRGKKSHSQNELARRDQLMGQNAGLA